MGIVAAYVVPHPPLIVPEVGRGEERAIQSTVDAYEEVSRRIASAAPDTIVVISPHAPLYRDCFHVSTGDAAHGSMGDFGAWDVSLNVSYDQRFVSALAACMRARGIPLCGSGTRDGELDHATFVPLYFVNSAYDDYRLVRVGLSGLSSEEHLRTGRCVAEAAADLGRKTVLIASGDLSHRLEEDGPYGFAPEGPEFDRNVIQMLESGNLIDLFSFDDAFLDHAAECGLRSFQVMAGALEDEPFSHELLSYEGPFGVGYAVAAFERKGGSSSERMASRPASRERGQEGAGGATFPDPLLELAQDAVEGFVRTGRCVALPSGLPVELAQGRAGVFVTIHAPGGLRGCIGTIEPVTGSIAEEAIRNAIAAASEDPRFPPVEADELGHLTYSVDVLFPPEPVGSLDELDPTRYGVIVTKGHRRGLLLPNLEGVETAAEQVAIAKRKAGIDVSDDGCRLERFEVVRHELSEARRA